MRVLVVNAGSSSLKLRVVDPDEDDDEPALEERDLAPDDPGLADALAELGAGCDAVGHRVVHGGPDLREAVVLDAATRAQLEAAAELAPLHQRPALDAVDAADAALGHLPAVACLDTAFHVTIPPAASTYALPRSWREEHGVRAYGFHGLSHAWVAHRVREELVPGAARIVSCHLGSGASCCAIADGRSVATTMGLTPLDGLVMGTRPGRVDPGALVHLARRGLSVDELSDGLEHGSGLRGLAGTDDLAAVLDRATAGDEDALLAREVLLHRLREAIAGMAAALGGLDVLAFTGGAGEASAELRARACAGLEFLGIALDEEVNERTTGDGEVGAAESLVVGVVVTAREDLEIARRTRDALA